jgi:lipid II:glycine glycyltransferase (peptidoglycan interpeptide bridge formation enzyme)
MIKYYIEKKNIGKPWDDFLKSHSRANSFQTSLFYNFYKLTNEFQPYFCIAADQKSKKILGGFLFVIQRKGRSFPDRLFRRSLLVGGPLIPSNGEKILDGLLSVYNDFIKRKVIYSEIRNLHSWSHQVDVFLKNGFKYEAHLNYQIPLLQRDVEGAFSKSKKRQIKKAKKSGAVIIENPDMDQIHQFYKILADLYSERINKPLPDWSFFKSFQEEVVAKGAGKYLLVHFDGKIIGGIMLPFFQQKLVYEWYVAGLDRKYKQAYPSVMATWAGIEYALKNNFSGFDFMGAGTPAHIYGVREFKSKFGGRLLNYGRFTNSHFRIIHALIKVFVKLSSKKS